MIYLRPKPIHAPCVNKAIRHSVQPWSFRSTKPVPRSISGSYSAHTTPAIQCDQKAFREPAAIGLLLVFTPHRDVLRKRGKELIQPPSHALQGPFLAQPLATRVTPATHAISR
jgi:hypothetical protein